MNFKHLKRDASIIHSGWVSQPNGTIVTRVPCKVIFPKHYLDGPLGGIDERYNVIGIFAIVMGDTYGVSKVISKIPFTPDETNRVIIDGDHYIELSWGAGSIICPNSNLVVNDKLAYEVYNEIVQKGKTPAYFNTVDLCTLFDSALKYANANLRTDHSILEIYTASRVRLASDRASYAREHYRKQSDITELDVDVIKLASVAFGATNTTARILGSYTGEGLNSALVNQATQKEEIEELLRS